MTLPLTVQFIVAMLAYALNERMARKAEYLREENRAFKEALRAATEKKRIPLSDEQRRRLAAKGKALTPAEREECCQIVRPSTLLAWFRQLVARKYDSSQMRTARSECLDHFLIFGERHLRHLLGELCVHYHGERFHQGLDGQLIRPRAAASNDNGTTDAIQCRSRLGGLLNFYHRQVA